MRIGIMTLFDNGNIGAALQAYALNAVLRREGHDCEDIRYVRVSNGCSDAQINRKKRALMLMNPKEWKLFAAKSVLRIVLHRKCGQRRARIAQFVRQYIPQSEQVYRGIEELMRAELPYDGYVCGSDNIWNKLKLDPAFFLAFVPDAVRRFSYAAGLSTSSFSEQEKQLVLPLIARLNGISVRDAVGARLLRSSMDRPVREDVDPTLLLTRQEWSAMRKPVANLPERYIFCYLLGNNPDARRAANLLKAETGMPIVCLPHATTIQTADVHFGDIRLYDIGPAEFLTLMSGAHDVITDSFHGCVFAIQFARSFAVFRRFLSGAESELNLRLDGLLDRVGCKGRICARADEVMRVLREPQDAQAIQERIETLRADSLAYLREMTKG